MRIQTLSLTVLSASLAAAGVATAKSDGNAASQPPARAGLLGANLGAKWRIATKNFGMKASKGAPILGARDVENDDDDEEDGDVTLSYSESAGEVVERRDVEDEDEDDYEEGDEELVARAEVPKHREQGVYYELKDTGAAVLDKRDADEEGGDVTLSYDEAAGEVEKRGADDEEDVTLSYDEAAGEVVEKREAVEELDEEEETGESWSPDEKLAARDVEDDEADEEVDESLEGYDQELVARDAELEDEEEDGATWAPEDADDAKLTARDVEPEEQEGVDYSLEGYDHELVARDAATGISLDDETPDGPTWSPGDKLTARDVGEDAGEEVDYSLEGYDHELVARDLASGIGLDDEVPEGPTWSPEEKLTARDVVEGNDNEDVDYSLDGYDHELVARDADADTDLDDEVPEGPSWSPGDKLTARDLNEEGGEEEVDYSLEGYDNDLVARDASYGHLHQETGNHPRDVHEGADDVDEEDADYEAEDDDEQKSEPVIAARAVPNAPAAPTPAAGFAHRHRGHGFHRGFHSKLFKARKTKAAGL